MGYWLELHCDVRGSQCLTTKDQSPERKVYASAAGLIKTAKEINTEAESKGWKHYPGFGWCCPNCVLDKSLRSRYIRDRGDQDEYKNRRKQVPNH